MDEIVARFRAWLGWKPARRVAVPQWLATLLYRLGDFAAFAAVVGILGLILTRPEIGWLKLAGPISIQHSNGIDL